MSRIKVTVLIAIVLGFAAYSMFPASQAQRTAGAMIQRTIPATWSSNERAIPKLQEKLKESPENADWNAALGEAYLQKARETGDPGYYTKAEGLFNRALASDHRSIQALIGQSSL